MQFLLPFESPPAAEQPGRAHRLMLPGGILSYTVVRARRRTLALFADANGVQARVPRQVTLAEIEAFIRAKEHWIRKRLAEARPRPFLWGDGALLPWLGCSLTLAVNPHGQEVLLCEDRLEIGTRGGGPNVRERALAWIGGQALGHFRARVGDLSARLGVEASAVRLSNARTLWGSCNARGAIRLNWRLMMFPAHLIDYVVAHELAHRQELNHSARFWAIVGKLYPDYAAARRELRRAGRKLPEF